MSAASGVGVAVLSGDCSAQTVQRQQCLIHGIWQLKH